MGIISVLRNSLRPVAAILLVPAMLAACGGSSGGGNGSGGIAISGTVSGLNAGASIRLLNNGTDALTVSSNGSFVFSTRLADGAAYSVTIGAQPSGEACGVSSGSGVAGSSNVTSIVVTCSPTSASLPWTWVGGSSQVYAAGVYGTQSTGSTSNGPGGRTYAVSWTDPGGNLWLFGGRAFDSTGVLQGVHYLNDLWKISPGTGVQTWVSGSSGVDATGVYGTQGVASTGNVPGARAGGGSWVDSGGKLWLFGGAVSTGTQGSFNDLWMFNPADGSWAWVSGSSAVNAMGLYGTQGTASTGNAPGARSNPVTWIDAAGNLWLFGGQGYDSTGAQASLNDLWKYNPGAGTWTWVSGASTVNATGVYGTQGVASTLNTPGARFGANAWVDAGGDLWLFGGYDVTGVQGGFNDLWKYSPGAATWTWVGGSSALNATGAYGTQGTASTSNAPGTRLLAISWADAAGNLWLFGGYQLDQLTGMGNYLNDLWKYNPAAATWTWVGGSSTPNAIGVYGATQGTASTSIAPGARFGASAWRDASGNLWLFSGHGFDSTGAIGDLADLWVVTP